MAPPHAGPPAPDQRVGSRGLAESAQHASGFVDLIGSGRRGQLEERRGESAAQRQHEKRPAGRRGGGERRGHGPPEPGRRLPPRRSSPPELQCEQDTGEEVIARRRHARAEADERRGIGGIGLQAAPCGGRPCRLPGRDGERENASRMAVSGEGAGEGRCERGRGATAACTEPHPPRPCRGAAKSDAAESFDDDATAQRGDAPALKPLQWPGEQARDDDAQVGHRVGAAQERHHKTVGPQDVQGPHVNRGHAARPLSGPEQAPDGLRGPSLSHHPNRIAAAPPAPARPCRPAR